MDDLKDLYREYFLQYAFYFILERAIPKVDDGLKPVQRRILHTLFRMDDGKLHKVANVTGQTMMLHPHGDAPIYEAMVNLANKGFLLDRQGNFGNIYTGDPAAAARYIETRLTPLAKETLFNPKLTSMHSSYDGRHQEPDALPAKIPLLLMQGAEGIAVGMATHILPHNFAELLNAQIAIIKGEPFTLYPDFLTGGIIDPSDYAHGKGRVRARAKIDIADEKTLVIREIPYGTTTDQLIRSIDEAAKKGQIKLESIHDYTAEKVEIEIKLPRGQYAEQAILSLYAFTECQRNVSSQIVVIRDQMPWETTVDQILVYQTGLLQGYLRRELEIERHDLLEKIFLKTLEQIFIENRLYKVIEEQTKYSQIHQVIAKELQPYHKQLIRIPEENDREYLLGLPLRRISLFDIKKSQNDILEIQRRLQEIEKLLTNIPAHAINYLKYLLEKYSALFPRRSQIQRFDSVAVKQVDVRKWRIGIDRNKGFIGTKVDTKEFFECAPSDKILLLFADGAYKVIAVPEKEYYLKEQQSPLLLAMVADKKTPFYLFAMESDTRLLYGKQVIIDKYILNKGYSLVDESMEVLSLTLQPIIATVSYKKGRTATATVVTVDAKELPIKTLAAKPQKLLAAAIDEFKLQST
jgi:topoisomerase-4 subunit A